MAQIAYRANLSAAEYPLTPELMGASVIVAGYDQSLSRYTDANESKNLSVGIPQIYHAENVLPTREGLASTQWRNVRDTSDYPQGSAGTVLGPYEVELFSELGDAFYGSLYAIGEPTATGIAPALVTYSASANTPNIRRQFTLFPSVEPGAWWPRNVAVLRPISSAYVQGRQFLHVWDVGTYVVTKLTDGTDRLDRVVLSGLDNRSVQGIVGANGYLLAYTANAIAWSTTLGLLPDFVVRNTAYSVGEYVLPHYREAGVDHTMGNSRMFRCTVAGTTAAVHPMYPPNLGATITDGTAEFIAEQLAVDFVPSLTTGAGGGVVEEVQGRIICARRTISGFILYTDQNMVVAAYTNNAQYPYNTRALPNCAGVEHQACVTAGAEAGWHYALTRNGIMQVSSTGTKMLYPAVQDWLRQGRGVKVDLESDAPLFTTYSTGLNISRLSYLRNRYLCISRGQVNAYGLPAYTDMLVYDSALDRFGCVSQVHNIPMAFNAPATVGTSSNTLQRELYMDTPGGVLEFRPTGSSAWAAGMSASWSTGLLVLGRYRHSRGQNILLQEVRLGAVYGNPHVFPLVSRAEGSSVLGLPEMYQAVAGTEANLFRARTLGRVSGTDVSLVIQGSFQLNSVELIFTTGGHR